MKKRKKEKISLSSKIATGSLVVFVLAGIIYFISLSWRRNIELPVLGEEGHVAGSFAFINQDGKEITERSVQHKVSVVEYFFTSCPSICPVMNQHLKQVYEKFKSDSDVVILSHTVDPERDSVSRMRACAGKLGAHTPGWQFLTGEKKLLYESATKDYLLSAADSGNDQFIHTQFIALLDRNRRIRGFYDFTKKENVGKLEAAIESLLNDRDAR